MNSPVIFTFTSPAVGERTFDSWHDGSLPDSYRVYNLPDIVPAQPLDPAGAVLALPGPPAPGAP